MMKSIFNFFIVCSLFIQCQSIPNLPVYQNNYKGKMIYQKREIPITVTLISNQIDDEENNKYSKHLFAQIIFEKEKVVLAMMGDRNHYDPNSTSDVSGDPIRGINSIQLQFQKDVLALNGNFDLKYQNQFTKLFKNNVFSDFPGESIALVGRDFSEEIKGNIYCVWCESGVYRNKIGEFFLQKLDSPPELVKKDFYVTETKYFIFSSSGETITTEIPDYSSGHSPFPSIPKIGGKQKVQVSSRSYLIYTNKNK